MVVFSGGEWLVSVVVVVGVVVTVALEFVGIC